MESLDANMLHNILMVYKQQKTRYNMFLINIFHPLHQKKQEQDTRVHILHWKSEG